jgi:hypothetical protein
MTIEVAKNYTIEDVSLGLKRMRRICVHTRVLRFGS